MNGDMLGLGRWLLFPGLVGWLSVIATPALALEGVDISAGMEVRVQRLTLDRGRGSSTAVVSIRTEASPTRRHTSTTP